jgi:hypothetical protein
MDEMYTCKQHSPLSNQYGEIQLKFPSFVLVLYNQPLTKQKCEVYHVHPNLHNVTPPLISPNPREQMCSVSISLLVITIPLIYHVCRHHTNPPKQFKPHACTHHVVVIIMIYCYYYNVDFGLFHTTITCYIDHLLSRIHVN